MTYGCRECETIALEINAAYQQAWESRDQQFREASIGVYNLIGGTEEDLERAEELVPKFKPNQDLSAFVPKFGPNLSRAGRFVLRKFAHEALTGHTIHIRTKP